MKRIQCLLVATLLLMTACKQQSDSQEAKPSAQAGVVEISATSQQEAGIKTQVLLPRQLPKVVVAPGEVVPNADLASMITPRVSAQVVKRLVQVGQAVKAGQPLILLSSVEMAKAQGEALIAAQEWARVKTLGQEAVSAKRYQEAEVTFQQAKAKLIAYGMTPVQATALLESRDAQKATGQFELLAPREGTVFKVNVIEGEVVEPGRPLMDIVNGTSLWVDARLSPQAAQSIKVGAPAWIIIDQRKMPGKVLQVHPQLDETTRTQIVRLEVPEPGHLLRPGQFVDCEIIVGQTAPILALPANALLPSPDGDWLVYVETAPNHFQQQEVKQLETMGNEVVIAGLKPGVKVVTQGAFLVHSELSKGGFETHGH